MNAHIFKHDNSSVATVKSQSNNIKEYQRISKNIKEHQRISKNIKEYQRTSKNIKSYLMMALNSIKKTFTSCYIPRRNSSVELAQDSMINETDENEIAKNTQWGSKPF